MTGKLSCKSSVSAQICQSCKCVRYLAPVPYPYPCFHFATDAPENVDGYLTVSDRPGLGIMVDLDVLGEPIAVYT